MTGCPKCGGVMRQDETVERRPLAGTYRFLIRTCTECGHVIEHQERIGP